MGWGFGAEEAEFRILLLAFVCRTPPLHTSSSQSKNSTVTVIVTVTGWVEAVTKLAVHVFVGDSEAVAQRPNKDAVGGRGGPGGVEHARHDAAGRVCLLGGAHVKTKARLAGPARLQVADRQRPLPKLGAAWLG